jgi:aryl-alcohol dehydrogenase-like predicted oxidoreductase
MKLLPVDPSRADTPWLWLGTWSMGGEGFGPHDERESIEVLNIAAENNIRHIDTAGFYAHGRSELLIRKVIRGNRREFFISTKGGIVWNGRNVEHRASPEALEIQIYESLERLGTDYLDLYQLHWPDPAVPVMESIQALKEFQRRGLIRFWGVEIVEYLKDEREVPHQVHFNPVHQARSVLAAGSAHCKNCITSPLEQGLLGSGESSRGKGGISRRDIRNRNPYFSDSRVLEWNERLAVQAGSANLDKVTAVLIWISAQPDVHVVIPGPRTRRQLKEILRFRDTVTENNLLAGEDDSSILSEERVRSMMPTVLWECLDRGPQGYPLLTCHWRAGLKKFVHIR